jgi:Mor family transcriptional regulator
MKQKNTAKNYKDRCERVAILYAEGKTYAEICNTLQCGSRIITKTVRKHGLKRHKKGKPTPDVNKDDILSDIEAGITISGMRRKYRISFYRARHIIETFKEKGFISVSKHDETKYHDIVDIKDINNDVMQTCIYINVGYGKALRCGRQLV